MPRRPLTDRQREIQSVARAQARMQKTTTQEVANREAIHSKQRVETESALASGRRNREFTGKAVDTLTPSGDSSLVMTTIFVMAGLIVIYLLVTSASQVGTLTDTLGNFLHKLTSTEPLFQIKSTA